MVELHVANVVVAGSSPVSRSIFCLNLHFNIAKTPIEKSGPGLASDRFIGSPRSISRGIQRIIKALAKPEQIAQWVFAVLQSVGYNWSNGAAEFEAVAAAKPKAPTMPTRMG